MRERLVCFFSVFVSLLIINFADYNTVLAQEINTVKEVSESDYEYQTVLSGITGEEWIEIEKYIGNDTDVVIPEEIDGKKVRKIGYGAFMNCTQITNVVIPDTVDTIGRYAFLGCTALESVSLPSGITSIPEAMFSGCTSLESIDFPEAVIECGRWAFLECTALKKVRFSEGLEVIGDGAFRECTSLADIHIPASVELIDVEAFMETNISVVKFLNKNVVIGDSAFRTFNSDVEHHETVVTIIGEKDSTAETFARRNFCLFQSIDGTYKVDYGNVVGCYDTALANYEAAIEFLNEFYIEKYPNLALAPLYGEQKEHEKFREIATEIISKDVNTDAPTALYNWMNENIHAGVEYGYPIDVYRYKTADCYGNANLLCQLLRSVNIPSVVVTGYTGDTINVMTEEMMRDGKLVGHAWVLVFYDGAWILLDSAMDRIFYQKEDIVEWYYMITVDDYLGICSDLFNPTVVGSLPCYKDGEFFIYGCSDFLYPVASWGIAISGENIYKQWYDFERSMWTYSESSETVQFALNKGGWIKSNGIGVLYLKDNMSILTNSIRVFDGITYWFNQNGNAFNITDLGNDIELYYGCPVVDVGDSFEISPVIATDIDNVKITWEVSNSSVVSIDKNGVFHALSDGRTRVSCNIENEETGSIADYLLYLYVRTEPNVDSIEKSEIELSAESFVYDGTAKQPDVTVKLNDKTLIAGTDYNVTYSNNTAVGTATVTISGVGNYSGTITKNFTITAASIKDAKITLSKTSYNYDGKAKKPTVTVKLGNKNLVKDKDYTITYKNNKNIGTATVTIKGKGNYTGTLTQTFTIKAKKGTAFTSGSYKYKVTGTSTVAFNGIKSTKTTKVTIPKTVKYGGKTFKVTSIADKALKGKTKVTKVIIGDNVTVIGKNAFYGCTKLSKVTMGTKIKTIGTSAFKNCSKLTKISIGKNVKTIGVSAFEDCKKLSKVTIGSAVTTIEDKAFKNCVALTSIIIPSKVTKIDKQAFYGCKKLKTITIKSTKLKTVGKEALKGINSKATIKVPKSKLSAYKKLFKGKGQGSKVKIAKYN